MVALGFLAGLAVSKIQFERLRIPVSLLDPLVFRLMVFGILGARIVYFAVDNFADLRADPYSFFRIWEGGLVFYGGVLAGIATLVIFSRRHRVPLLLLTDAFAAPLLLSHAIGRLGCLAAGCCYGKETTLPWALTFTNPASLAPRFLALHPTQLYESIGNFVLFLGLFALSKRPLKRGTLTSLYLVSYGVFRFFMEFLRGDDRGLYRLGVSPSQLVAILLTVGGVWLFVHAQKKESF